MYSNPLSPGRSALLLMALGTVSQMLSFFYRVALSRLIGAELLGLYQLLMSAYSVMVAFTAVGLTSATSNLSAQYLALGNRRGADGVRRLALRLFLLLLLPITLVVVICSDSISVYLLGDARTQLGLVLLLPCVLLTGIENIHKHFFYGAGRVVAPAVTELIEQGVRAIAVLGLLLVIPPSYAERQVGLIVVGMVICEIFSAFILVQLYRLWLRHNSLSGAGDTPSVLRRRVAGMAVPIGLNALLGNLIGAANATLLPQKLVEGGVSHQDAMTQFGITCGMTLPMLALPTVLLSSLGLVLIPRLSRSVALGRGDFIAHYIHRALSAVSITMLPAMGLMAVIGGDLGVLLFQQEGVDRHLIPLVIAMALSCYQITFTFILNGICRQRTATAISLLCGGLQLAVTMLAVPQLGMVGYVWGVVCSSAIGTLLSLWRVMAETKVSLGFFELFIAPALGTVLMALCANLLHHWLCDMGVSLLTSCCATLLFSTILYLAALEGQGVSVRKVLRVR